MIYRKYILNFFKELNLMLWMCAYAFTPEIKELLYESTFFILSQSIFVMSHFKTHVKTRSKMPLKTLVNSKQNI